MSCQRASGRKRKRGRNKGREVLALERMEGEAERREGGGGGTEEGSGGGGGGSSAAFFYLKKAVESNWFLM